ncbi:MAG: Stk1 family PASTA domain-containing Ser/Thr kinase [Roseburia sp.]|nr:Stk1 family PASTA domain-containing Ser/Thr kinase [Roseburia sp.]
MLTEGMYVADRYEILGKIGAGGMSDVFKAKDLTLGRFVAIKVLKPEFSEDLNFVTKFRTEAQSAAGLEHPNIVNIYDVGSENGMHYIVMEYVEGITLKTYIEKKGQLTYKEAISIAIQVGRGIEAAHNKGIIHRDIKPQNIIISTEGKVKVTDFGIARAASSNTISSDVMGSVHYSSPEQARNGFVDGKSDIYSMGIVMYEMVTGRVPFDGDTTVAVAIQHLQEEMVRPSIYAPELPVSMEKIILKCTQKNPDRRYESISALLADLRKALVSPNEDFVVMIPVTSQDKTRVIREDDLSKIQKEAATVRVKPGKIQEPEEEEDEDIDDDELEGDDTELNPKLEKAITIMGIAAALVIVALIIFLVVNVFGGMKPGNKDNTEKNSQKTESSQQTGNQGSSEVESESEEEGIEVPDLAGKTYEEAFNELNALGLGIKQTGTESSDEYEQGEIVRQDPEYGTMVEQHTTVEIIVSSGKGSIPIPSVVGKSETDAYNELNETFKVNKTYAYSDTVAEGYVISQSPSTEAKEGETVTIVISQGVEMVSVPSLTEPNYTSETDAKKKLNDLGLKVEVKTAYSDKYVAQIVMEQSIPAGTLVEKNTTITLTVSLGKEPQQDVTATTYKCNIRLTIPSEVDAAIVAAASTADVTIYDDSGEKVLATLSGQPVVVTDADKGTKGIEINKSGLLSSKGKISATIYDASGAKLIELSADNLNFTPES